MALEVGNVLTRLGYKIDDREAQRYKRETHALRQDAKRDIRPKAGLDVDHRGIDGYQRSLRDVDQSHGKLVRGSGRLKSSLGSLWVGGAGVAAGGLAFAGLAKGVMGAYGAFEESNKIAKQTDAVLKSTGGAAGVTAKQVSDLSTAISKKTGIDDEAIQSGENMLLTFTNVRNEAGKGNDVFNRATQTITDMSAALGQDTKSSAIQLGKALNDPIKGVTALQRVGVSFTEDQKKQIATMVKHGDTVKAQKLILGELSKEFGGSAAAQATWGDKLKVTWGNLQETIGGALAPAIEKAAKFLDGFLNGMQDGTGAGGKFVTMLKGAGGAVRDVVRVGAGLVGLFKSTGTSSSDAAKGVRSGVGSIRSIVLAVWGTLKKTFGDIRVAFRGVGDDFRIIGTRLAQVWGFVWTYVSAVVKRALPGIRALISGLALVIRGVVDVIAGLLTGDFGRIWEGVKRIVGGAVRAVGGLIRGMTAAPREVLSKLGEWAGDVGAAAVRAGKRLVSGVIDQATKLPGELWRTFNPINGRMASLRNMLVEKAADAGAGLVKSLVGKARSLPGDLLSLGKRAVSALGRGLAGLPGAIVGALKGGASFLGGIGRGIADWINAHTPFGDKIKVGPVSVRLPALARGGKVGPGAGGARLFVAGEGDRDEWVISQEGDRGSNVRWAIEALQTLTGRGVALYRGGTRSTRGHHRHAKPKPLKKILTPGQVSSAVTGQERGLANFDRDLARMERVYGQLERDNSLTTEEFIIEKPDGSTVIDPAAIKTRTGEIDEQIAYLKANIGDKLRAYKRAISAALKVYDTLIGRLGRAIARAKGKRRASERQGYVTKRNEYVARRGELSDKFADLDLDLEDNRLDIQELDNEKADVKGTKPTAAPAPDAPDASAPAPADASPGAAVPGDASPAPADATPTPPTAEEIATAAAAEFSSFLGARADLFSSFGGNAVPAMRLGGIPGDVLGMAAGLGHLGGSGQAGVTVNIENHYGAGPGDAHTWSQQQRRQVEVALG